MSIAYPIIMGAALITGFLISRKSQRRLELQTWQRSGILFGALCGAMLAAKLPFVISDWDGLVTGAAWFQNGKTILCGLAGGYFGVVVAKWSLGVQVRTGDSFAVPVAATVAIGRIACFNAQCCYGTPTDMPWAVVFHKIDLLPRHPTQLYEALFHASLAIVMWRLNRAGIFRGNLFKFYIVCYSIYRFLSEVIRPEARLIGGLTAYQWGALLLLALFGYLWYRDAQPLRRGAIQATPNTCFNARS